MWTRSRFGVRLISSSVNVARRSTIGRIRGFSKQPEQQKGEEELEQLKGMLKDIARGREVQLEDDELRRIADAEANQWGELDLVEKRNQLEKDLEEFRWLLSQPGAAELAPDLQGYEQRVVAALETLKPADALEKEPPEPAPSSAATEPAPPTRERDLDEEEDGSPSSAAAAAARASPKLQAKVAEMMQDLSSPAIASEEQISSSLEAPQEGKDEELEALLEEAEAKEQTEGKPKEKKKKAKEGKIKEVEEQEEEEKNAKGDMQFPVMFEDANILAIAKPVGCSVIPNKGDTDALLAKLKAKHGNNLWPVAALDNQASGLVLLAKNQQTLKTLSHDLSTGDLAMNFIAWVDGKLNKNNGIINIPLQSGRESKMRPAEGWVQGPGDKLRDDSPAVKHSSAHQMVNAVTKKHKLNAVTKFSISRVFELGKPDKKKIFITRVLLQPLTQRQHQLRVHMRAVDLPLFVDKQYGFQRTLAADALGKGSPALDCLPLHVMSIVFTHPQTKERTKINCPLASCNMDLKRFDNWLADNSKKSP